ncbi:MAG: hypothetical protein HDS85_05755 [Bacteroidales bacterium]|nr:hypothetical protein [Bacteroidales bacterium]
MSEKFFKRLIAGGVTLLLSGLFSFQISARPVSPDEARREADAFISSNPILSTRTSAALKLKPQYEGKAAGETAFYVFADNDAGAFVILGGDTRIPKVLAYSFSSGFDSDNIPPDVKWWLGQYEGEIERFLATNPSENVSTRGIVYDTTRKFIEPLIKTKWNQSEPFNQLCPEINGMKTVTGCVATAMAQAMKYYNWPPKGEGSNDDYSFAREYNWDLMLDEYNRNSYLPSQATAVATLMLACGKSVNMQYSPYASGAYAHALQYALPTYFDYSKEVRHIIRDFYSQAEWNEIIYQELLAGRPVIYGGQSSEGGHSFVCDGYSEDGFFHINWGWGGLSDGYFRLNALTPSENGIGGYEGGYNLNQTALINLKKNDGKGEMQRMMVSDGPFTYTGGTFVIGTVNGQSGVMFNALSQTMFVYAGVKILNEKGELVRYVEDPEGAELPAYYGFGGFILDIPELPDGTYHLYPVFRTEDSDWMPILIPYGMQQYVGLTVSDGNQNFFNPGVPESMKTALVASDVIVSENPSVDCPVSFRCYINNVGGADFLDNVNLKIADSAGDSVLEFMQSASIPAASSDIFVATTTMDIPEGDYTVTLFDNDNNIISEPVKFHLGTTLKPSSSSSNLSVEITGPAFVQSTASVLSLYISNHSSQTQPLQLNVRLLSPDGENVLHTLKYNAMQVPAHYRGPLSLRGLSTVNTFGNWLLDIVDDSGAKIASPFPVTVVGTPFEVDDVAYAMTGLEDALISAPLAGQYTATVKPENAEYFYVVRGIDGNAMTFATTLKELILPETVTRIGAATLYCASQLETITLESATPGEVSSLALPENRFSEVVLKVPAEAANIYKRTPGWSKFNIPGWSLNIDNEVSVLSGLDKNENGEIFEPYYVRSGSPLIFTVQLPPETVAEVSLTYPSGQTEKVYSSDGKISLPAITKGVGQASVKAVSAESVDTLPADYTDAPLYDIDGRLIREKMSATELSSLERGLYVYGGKVIIVR